MKKLLHFVEKILGVYRWHPTIALRYLPIVDYIKNRQIGDEELLEVGSAGLGIAPYYKKKVVGLDISFSQPIHENLVAVKGTGTEIPFADNSYPVVVSTDMLEHLSRNDRTKAIKEMLRISGKLLCLGVPCGKAAQAQDEKLSLIYKSNHFKEFDFFTEHKKHGMPEKKEILDLINESARNLGKTIHIGILDTLNLRLREWLMRGWISQNLIKNIFFRKGLLLALPLLRRLNQPPTYRCLFFISIHNDQVVNFR